jgi:hypothetical protein
MAWPLGYHQSDIRIGSWLNPAAVWLCFLLGHSVKENIRESVVAPLAHMSRKSLSILNQSNSEKIHLEEALDAFIMQDGCLDGKFKAVWLLYFEVESSIEQLKEIRQDIRQRVIAPNVISFKNIQHLQCRWGTDLAERQRGFLFKK